MARAVGDWDHYAEFFPFVVASAAAAQPRPLVRLTIDPPGPFRRRLLVAEVDGDIRGVAPRRTWRFAWRARDGAADPAWGAWTIRELGPATSRVEIRLDGHLGLPAALERRALARTLPWILDGLAQQVLRCRYDEPRHASCPEEPPFTTPARPAPRGQR